MCEDQGREINKVVKNVGLRQKIINVKARVKAAFLGNAPFISNMLP